VLIVYHTPQRWYDYETGRAHGGAPYHTIDTPLAKMPVFQRGGSVLVRKDRPRRSTTQMKDDPYTLVVALNGNGAADGELYVDDGKSYDYQTKNAYLRRNFRFQGTELTSTSVRASFFPLSCSVHLLALLSLVDRRRHPPAVNSHRARRGARRQEATEGHSQAEGQG
jgi:alpha 1,3-glucosidase